MNNDNNYAIYSLVGVWISVAKGVKSSPLSDFLHLLIRQNNNLLLMLLPNKQKKTRELQTSRSMLPIILPCFASHAPHYICTLIFFCLMVRLVMIADTDILHVFLLQWGNRRRQWGNALPRFGEEPLTDMVKFFGGNQPGWQGSRGPLGTHLGPVGPRWAPCWPHEPCYQGKHITCLLLHVND